MYPKQIMELESLIADRKKLEQSAIAQKEYINEKLEAGLEKYFESGEIADFLKNNFVPVTAENQLNFAGIRNLLYFENSEMRRKIEGVVFLDEHTYKNYDLIKLGGSDHAIECKKRWCIQTVDCEGRPTYNIILHWWDSESLYRYFNHGGYRDFDHNLHSTVTNRLVVARLNMGVPKDSDSVKKLYNIQYMLLDKDKNIDVLLSLKHEEYKLNADKKHWYGFPGLSPRQEETFYVFGNPAKDKMRVLLALEKCRHLGYKYVKEAGATACQDKRDGME